MPKKLTYKSTGVDISKAQRFVAGIQHLLKDTKTDLGLQHPGAFGSLVSFPKEDYREPVLVSSTDGVGTKLLIARLTGRHEGVGVDLVAMNVNDILCMGAKPLFFLDYIACGKLKSSVLRQVVRGIAQGCRLAGCPLVGGETAQMSGMYKDNEYDLAGFAVGVVEKTRIIDGSQIQRGDRLIGLASSGLHSNGFSLVRAVFSLAEQKEYALELLKPTRIYVKVILPLLEKFRIKGIAHLTGGAYYRKLTKIVPDGKCFKIKNGSWTIPEIFQRIQKKGRLSEKEMFTTFNMGIGMVLVVSQSDVNGVQRFLSDQGAENWAIGEVVGAVREKVVIG